MAKRTKKVKITQEEAVEIFQEEAEAVAKHICGSERCICAYSCGHSNKKSVGLSIYGSNETCPLAKYNIEPDTRTFREKVEAGENPIIDLQDCIKVCACCEYSDVIEEGGDSYTIERSEKTMAAFCIDCPVNATMENIQECMAEAGMEF